MSQEAVLIREAQTGVPEAFDALVSPHLPRAYRVAYLITRNQESASDALQEALLRAYRSLRNLKVGYPFYPWFSRILINEALKQARRGRYWLVPWHGSQAVATQGQTRDETPEQILQQREEQQRLWKAIERLSPAHRAVIVLRYYEELSEAEMATALAIRPGTVKSRLHHARAALEQALQKVADQERGPVGQANPALQGGEGHA